MDKRIKRILIIVFIIIFFLGGPLAIFYSRGYRFDWESRKVVKSGGLSFKTKPESCEIYLDGKPKKRTDFLFGNAFIKNLVPKKYNIRIEKEGYFPWEKSRDSSICTGPPAATSSRPSASAATSSGFRHAAGIGWEASPRPGRGRRKTIANSRSSPAPSSSGFPKR